MTLIKISICINRNQSTRRSLPQNDLGQKNLRASIKIVIFRESSFPAFRRFNSPLAAVGQYQWGHYLADEEAATRFEVIKYDPASLGHTPRIISIPVTRYIAQFSIHRKHPPGDSLQEQEPQFFL